MEKLSIELRRCAAVLFLALGLASCASTPPLSQADLAALEIGNPQIIGQGVVTGGQPSASDLKVLKQRGFGTIINLRTAGEDLGFDEAAEAKALGLTYVSIPVSVGEGLDVETAVKLRAALAQSNAPTLVHCGSGNRVGALYAIGAYHLDGASLESALEVGRKAGLTRLEPKIREILDQ